MPVKTNAKPERSVKLEPVEGIQTLYSNCVRIDRSQWDLRFRFGQIQHVTKEEMAVQEQVYVYMSPQHAKAFAALLNRVLEGWEKDNGVIGGDAPQISE